MEGKDLWSLPARTQPVLVRQDCHNEKPLRAFEELIQLSVYNYSANRGRMTGSTRKEKGALKAFVLTSQLVARLLLSLTVERFFREVPGGGAAVRL